MWPCLVAWLGVLAGVPAPAPMPEKARVITAGVAASVLRSTLDSSTAVIAACVLLVVVLCSISGGHEAEHEAEPQQPVFGGGLRALLQPQAAELVADPCPICHDGLTIDAYATICGHHFCRVSWTCPI